MTLNPPGVDIIESQDWGPLGGLTREYRGYRPTSLSRLYPPGVPGLGPPNSPEPWIELIGASGVHEIEGIPTAFTIAMALPRKRPPIYLGGQTNRNPSRRPGRQPSSPSDFCSCNKNSLQCRAPVAIRNLQRNSDGSWRLHLPSSRGLAVSCGQAWRDYMSSEPRLSFRLR